MSIWTILFVVLLIAWIGGFTVFHVAGGLIHLLLVLAVISLIVHFVTGRDGLMIGLSSEKPHRRKAAGLYQHSESTAGTNRSPSLHP